MIRANQRCIDQAIRLVDLLDDAQYASPRGAWSAVGAQLRHVIEHYQCFIEGLPEQRIDYDSRRRDALIENSRARARDVLVALREDLDTAPRVGAVQVQMRCDVNDGPSWATSSIERELQFLISHSVHHFALIKLLIAGDGIPLDDDFGTAPSTVAHARSAD